MEILKKLAWCLLVSAILTACGGGGDDTSSNISGIGINTQESNWDNAQWDNSSWK